MGNASTIVLDVGKTLAKLTLWGGDGAPLERRERPNPPVMENGRLVLDARGIEAWLADTLRDFARHGPAARLVPVAHGAALALLRDGALAVAPDDYEAPIPPDQRRAYDADRDPFARTGSPALPGGLNAGAQLDGLQRTHPALFAPGLASSTAIVTWPQYWAWLLCGVAATEVTSLGCHTDLWWPESGRPSAMAERRGWAALLAPVRPAPSVLGTLTPAWQARTGLPGLAIHCGLHDSNAALLAARAFPGMGGEATVLSTGTWFVAMRTPAPDAPPPLLPESRDCLVNVDVAGRPVPSARFMGGREIERLLALDDIRIDSPVHQAALAEAAPGIVRAGAMALPGFAPGCGPFPDAQGHWHARPDTTAARAAAICLYLALMADAALDLIGARDRLLIEGRFAAATLFVQALAALRPHTRVSVAQTDASHGALRLVSPGLPPPAPPATVTPLGLDLGPYRAAWRQAIQRTGLAA